LKAALPPNELQRLDALRALGILDTEPEQAFDDIVRLASHICRVPISAVSLVDADRQWFKAQLGLPVCETSRASAFCAHTLLNPAQTLVVPDATLDARFADNPLVVGEPRIRFYAGAPLVDREGYAFGSLCVIDTVPRALDASQIDALAMLARQVMRQLESRQLVVELAEQKAAVDHHSIVAIADTSGRLTYVNDRLCAIAQKSRADLLGVANDFFSLLFPSGELGSEARLALANGFVWRGELQGRAQDGSGYWIQSTLVPIKNAKGIPWQYIAIGTDITALKQVQNALKQQQDELRLIFDLVPAMVFFKDKGNRILRVNRLVAENTGKSIEAIEGKPCSEIYPQDAANFYADDLEVIRSGLPKLGIIERVRGRDGKESWFQTDKVPYRDKDGKVIGIVVMAQNITERKRTEEMLRLLSSALEQSNDAITITDAQLDRPGPRILFVNAAFTAMTGYTSADALGQTPRISQGPRTDRAVGLRVREALARGRSFQSETINHRKDGTAYDLEWQVAPIRNLQGVVTNFVSIQRDISARKAAELELARARDEALESSRLKSRFLANMSHELRTPLNTINGLSATLIEQDLPPHAHHAAALILQCGETLLENIKTILTHSSLEAGKAALEDKPFALIDVVLHALRITGPAAQRKGIDLDYQLDPTSPAHFVGDPFRLQQVLVNLLANAIKFTDRGRVYLRLRARAQPAGRWELHFAVADTGIGIAPENLPKLFKPFSQVDDTSTRRFEGSGLGLAITKSLVELMGGQISVVSRPGIGSLFRFALSLPAVAGAPGIFANGARPELAGKRLLIVTSNSARPHALRAMAQAWQLHVTVGDSADAAVALPAGEHFDLAIRLIPGPGDAPLAISETDATARSIPVVWLSPQRHTPAVLPVSLPGRSVVIYVPFDPIELSEALVSLLRTTNDAPASETPSRPRPRLGDRIPLRLLSADDNRTNRASLNFICQHLGYQTDLVENGAEVLERLAAHTYDLILLDVQMPVMDGLSAAQEICRRYPTPGKRPRLVAVTAGDQPGDRERCLAAGMDDFLSKPLLPKALQVCIERHFGGAATSAPGGSASPTTPVFDPNQWIDIEHLKQTTEGLENDAAADLIVQLFTASKADFDALRPRLAEACALRQVQQLSLCIHGLKGCVLSLGWTRMGSRCLEAHRALKENRFEAWVELPRELDKLFRMSTSELERSLATFFGSAKTLFPRGTKVIPICVPLG